MPVDQSPRRRTPEQIVAEQNRQAETERKRKLAATLAPTSAPPTNMPVVAKTSLPAASALDTRTTRQRYLDSVAPTTFVGRLIKFDPKTSSFVAADDGEPISGETDIVALCGDVQAGLIKFGAKGEDPERHMGLLYDPDFTMPAREDLGDLDPGQWPEGLSGKPEDPWKHQMNLPLQQRESGELYTFSTQSATGRRAVGNLLRHYDRLIRTHPDDVPVVRLKVGGFHHKDERIGWVATPVFAVVGRAPRDSAAVPDTSPAADMDDALPF